MNGVLPGDREEESASGGVPDVQAGPPRHARPLSRVGVSSVRHPARILDADGAAQTTVAAFTLAVDLPARQRGAHLSRLMEVLGERHGTLSLAALPDWLAALRERLDARRAFLRADFPWTVAVAAPRSGARGRQVYDAWLRAEDGDAGPVFGLGLTLPVTGLCPCSREISDYGAHNQRVYVEADVDAARGADGAWAAPSWTELAELLSGAGSSPVYPVLKRADERVVTMDAYDAPAFVEDVAREAAERLASLGAAGAFRVKATAQESVHAHDVFAVAVSAPDEALTDKP